MKKTALLLTLLLLITSGCVGSNPQPLPDTTTAPSTTTSTMISQGFSPPEKGDIVSIDYTVTWQGEVYDTTIEELSGRSQQRELIESMHPDGFRPFTFKVDTGSANPVTQLFSRTVKTINPGDTTSLSKSAEVFGWTRREELVQTQPRSFTVPIEETLSSEEFQKLFEKQPKKGMQISWYKHWNSTVSEIESGNIRIVHNPINGSTYTGLGGTITIQTNTDTITTTFNPTLGKTFLTPDKRYLTYTNTTSDTVTADYNHPLAGKTIQIEITLKNITRP